MDQIIFFEQPNAATALQQVSQGNEMQIYMFNLRNLADKLAALSDPNIWTVQTPGSVNDLWINPVPYGANVSGYNPFQLQAVRRAMTYLVDRNFIKNEIYGVFAIPYIAPWSSKQPEYRREQTFMQGLDTDYGYNPTKAAAETDNMREWSVHGAINAAMSVFSYLETADLAHNKLPPYYNQCELLP